PRARARRDYRVSGVGDGIEPPRAGHALQLVLASLVEGEPGAGHEVLHGGRDEHLPGARERGHSRADVDRQAAELVTQSLALPRVQPGAHLEAEVADRPRDRLRAVDRPDR